MKSDNATGLRTCPRCGAQYGGVPLFRESTQTRRFAPTVAHGRLWRALEFPLTSRKRLSVSFTIKHTVLTADICVVYYPKTA